jgi:hypothetical protein
MSDEIDDPTEREYHLECKVAIKTVRSFDQKPNGEEFVIDRTMAFLIPEYNDQCTYFLNAWLPETREEVFEIATFIKPPIASPCRVGIRRGNEIIEKHHMVVMSKGIEEELVDKKFDGKSIRLQVLPASMDNDILAHEKAKDSSGSFHVW